MLDGEGEDYGKRHEDGDADEDDIHFVIRSRRRDHVSQPWLDPKNSPTTTPNMAVPRGEKGSGEKGSSMELNGRVSLRHDISSRITA